MAEQEELVASLDSEERYSQAVAASIMIPVWLVSGRKYWHLVFDLQQDFWAYWYDPEIVKEGEPVGLAFHKVKQKLIDLLRSKRYNYSYGDVKQHVSLDAEYHNGETVLVKFGVVSISDRTRMRQIRMAFAAKGCSEDDLIIGPLCEQLKSMVSERTWRALWENKVEGWAQREVGEGLGRCRSTVTKIESAGIKEIRKRIGIAV